MITLLGELYQVTLASCIGNPPRLGLAFQGSNAAHPLLLKLMICSPLTLALNISGSRTPAEVQLPGEVSSNMAECPTTMQSVKPKIKIT